MLKVAIMYYRQQCKIENCPLTCNVAQVNFAIIFEPHIRLLMAQIAIASGVVQYSDRVESVFTCGTRPFLSARHNRFF